MALPIVKVDLLAGYGIAFGGGGVSVILGATLVALALGALTLRRRTP